MAENSPSPAGAAHAWDQARLWRSLALLAPRQNRQDTSTLMQSVVSLGRASHWAMTKFGSFWRTILRFTDGCVSAYKHADPSAIGYGLQGGDTSIQAQSNAMNACNKKYANCQLHATVCQSN
jgi:hypothetical protein